MTESQFSMIPGVGAKRASKIAHVLDTKYPGWQEQEAAEQVKLEGGGGRRQR